MLKLIVREIDDNIIYFIIALILLAIIAGFMFYPPFASLVKYRIASIITVAALIISAILFSGMGANQIYADKNKKVLAFLSTLAVTRPMIFTAKLISGLLAIASLFVPVFIVSRIWVSISFSLAPYKSVMNDYFLAAFLLNVVGYSIGLITGWVNGKIIPILGGLLLTLFLYGIIIIKGIGPGDLLGVLVPFILSCWIIAWRKFKNASF